MTYLRRDEIADVDNALELMPADCLYHGKRFIRVGTSWRTHSKRFQGSIIEPCCGDGTQAFRRYFAKRAILQTGENDAIWPRELTVARTS